MPRCSIVIPVYNRAALTRNCLQLIFGRAAPRVSNEIIVVDNGSQDLTREVLQEFAGQLTVLPNERNEGFSAACNQGAAAAQGEFILFLNNDTLPEPRWLDTLVAYADEHPQAAIIGSKLLFPNDFVQHAGVVVCQDRVPRHVYAGFPANHPAVNKSRRFQIVTGACLLIRRAVFESIGGFDATFVNGYEDVDLCLRVGERGGEVHYCHESVVYHLESVSAGRFDRMTENDRLYRERWANRVTPDDLSYYVQDGLLTLSYATLYPVDVRLSAELATVVTNDRVDTLERALWNRSRLMEQLLRDSIRLSVLEGEQELQQASVRGQVQPSGAAPRIFVTADPVVLSRGSPRRLSHESSGRLISVIMPVKNGEQLLRANLPILLGQRCSDELELIAIDSGSQDRSVEVLQDAGATVIQIDPRTYNHGLTRKLGTRYARGHLYVFLNQSTRPANEEWLAGLLKPFDDDPLLAGVCSRVVPRPDADLLTRKDGLRDVSGSPERSIRWIADRSEYARLSHHQLRLLVNFHTVSAAIRPQVFDRVPFRAVTTIGEDIQWAKDVLETGFKIQHEPSSVILHSHNYSIREILERNVDDGIANREIVGRTFFEHELEPSIRYIVRDDWQYLEQECGLTGTELDDWRQTSVLRRTAQMVGQWIGVNQRELPPGFAEYLSLTARLMAGAAAAPGDPA